MLSRRSAALGLNLVLVFGSSGACLDGGACTEIACESVATVSYGSMVVNEPYTLIINPDGVQIAVICLGEPSDEPQPPEWLRCDADGFTITGSQADLLTAISVTVVPVATEEAVIASALVILSTDEVNEPNGPDCEPTCYTRSGAVPEPPPP
jgi:hypothetical protein